MVGGKEFTMYRRKFVPQRSQAIAERVARVRRLNHLRRVIVDSELSLVVLAGDPRIGDGDRELILRSPLH